MEFLGAEKIHFSDGSFFVSYFKMFCPFSIFLNLIKRKSFILDLFDDLFFVFFFHLMLWTQDTFQNCFNQLVYLRQIPMCALIVILLGNSKLLLFKTYISIFLQQFNNDRRQIFRLNKFTS